MTPDARLVDDDRIRNLRAWASARVGSLSGADVTVAVCDELLALRANNQQGREWQPIETAPRDSSRILVGYRDVYGEWQTRLAWWRMPYESAPLKNCWWCYDKDCTLLSADVHLSPEGKPLGATHWQPLPPPFQGAK